MTFSKKYSFLLLTMIFVAFIVFSFDSLASGAVKANERDIVKDIKEYWIWLIAFTIFGVPALEYLGQKEVTIVGGLLMFIFLTAILVVKFFY